MRRRRQRVAALVAIQLPEQVRRLVDSATAGTTTRRRANRQDWGEHPAAVATVRGIRHTFRISGIPVAPRARADIEPFRLRATRFGTPRDAPPKTGNLDRAIPGPIAASAEFAQCVRAI